MLQERALRITVDTLNEEGVPVGNLRRRVKMIYRDNGSQPDTAAQQATELIQKEDVHALLGGVLAETSLAMVNVAQTEQVPFISLGSRRRHRRRRCGAHLHLQAPARTPETSRGMMADLVDDPGAEQGRRRLLQRQLRQAGPRRSAQQVSGTAASSNPSFRPGSNVATGRRPRWSTRSREVVIVWAQAPDSGAAATALRNARFAGEIVFDPGGVADDTLTDANKEPAEQAYAVHPASLAGTSLTDTTMADLDRARLHLPLHPEARRVPRLRALQLRRGAADRQRRPAGPQRRPGPASGSTWRTSIAEGIAGSYDFQPISHGGMTADSLAVFQVTSGAWIRIS